MERDPKRQKKDQSTKREQGTSEMSQESTPMDVPDPAATRPDDGQPRPPPSPAHNDHVGQLDKTIAKLEGEIEALRKEIKRLEDHQNALRWFNMSYWFPGGIQTRINFIEQQVLQKEKRLTLQEEKKEAQAAKRQRMDDGDAGDVSEPQKSPITTDMLRRVSDVVLPPTEEPQFTAEDDWLGNTLLAIQHGYDSQDGSHRVPPMALVRCSRGGKTRALKEIARALRSKGISALYVSFNDYSSLGEWDKENPILALCTRIAFEALLDRDHEKSGRQFKRFNTRFVVSQDTILEWLDEEPCVLLIDELNNMPLNDKFAKWLKENFLTDKGKYLVFSSHVTSTTGELSKFMETASSRSVVLKPLPLIPTLQRAKENFNWQSITPQKALYYGLIPALLYEASNDVRSPGRLPTAKRDQAIIECRQDLDERKLKMLIGTFITGNPDNVPSPLLQLMTTSTMRDGEESKTVVHWIPFHMMEALTSFSNGDFGIPSLKHIPELFTGFRDAKIESGDSWENLFVAVVLMRCISGQYDANVLPPFQGSNDIRNANITYQSPFSSGRNFDTNKVEEFLEGIKEPDNGEYPHIGIFFPTHATFELYDVIVVYFVSKGKRLLYGYQLREGKKPPSKAAMNCQFTKSYVIRGKPPKSTLNKMNWITPNQTEVSAFFGESGRHWTPTRWSQLREGS